MKTVLKNATLLSEYGYDGKRVCIVIENQKITEITEKIPALTAKDEVIDCGGNLLMPGFYNAHCHAAMTLFRGYGEDLPLQKWLDTKILPAEDRLTYESVFLGTKLAIAEMLRTGTVSFSDMYMFENAVGDAVLDTGIKANISRNIVSFDNDADIPNEYRVKEALDLADRYHKKGEGRLLVDLSLHAEYTNVPNCCKYIAAQAKERGLRIQLHLSETRSEHEKCIGRHGITPTRFFEENGVLEVPVTAAHGVYLTDDDMNILVAKGATVAHNPVSNLKLGSGVMNLRKLLDKGVNVALGTDGVASNNRLDMLKDLQLAAILHKGVNCDPAIVTAQEMPKIATRNGALSQGRTDCGIIEVGARADLILIDRNSIHNIPCYDDYAMLCYSATSEDVLFTMVDGRILYRNGEYTSIDEERLRYDFREMLSHYFD